MPDSDTFEHGRFKITLVRSGGPWHEQCYVVLDRMSQEQIIVDPGGRAEAIRSVAEAGNAPVTAVVLTHAHHDHVGAAAEVAEHFDVSCYIHSADFLLLRKAPTYSVAFGGKVFPPVKRPVALELSERLVASSGEMHVLHTPGHTLGSSCLIFPGFAFTGDTLLQRRIGRTDLPGSDQEALIDSVDKLLGYTTDDDVLYGGHGEPWRANEARQWWAEVHVR